jgi:hypothetical protein
MLNIPSGIPRMPWASRFKISRSVGPQMQVTGLLLDTDAI